MFFQALVTVALAAGVHCSPAAIEKRAPTVYLAGDSTTAKTSNGLDGWGPYLSKYVTIAVTNKAISGRSARSFTNEGRFAEIEKAVVSGDIVVIEFGHNDGGSPNSASDNGRSNCPGTGSEVCKSGKTGETVYTFNYYVEKAARAFIAKGANVIFSSQTPRNTWQNGVFNGEPSRYVGYMAAAARNVGRGSSFVDHNQAVVQMYARLGSAKVNSLYPKDYTHTSPEGGDLVAQAFVTAIARDYNGTTPLKAYVKNPAPKVFAKMASRLVLITGVNGYIATHTAAAFLQAGYAVRGTVRARTPALLSTLNNTLSPYHDGTRFEIVEVPDIGVPNAFDRAVEGVHAIAHLASPVSMTATDPAPMMRAAVDGTTSLLASALSPAATKDLRSVVFMSTISAIFSPLRSPGHVFTEADWNDVAEKQVAEQGPSTPGYVIYQASKTAAERAFWANQPPATPVRMPRPRTPLYIPTPITRLSMRVKDIHDIYHGFPIPEFSPIRSTFVDVRDVATLVLRAVESPTAAGRYLLVGNESPISPQAMANLLNERYPERKGVIIQVGSPGEAYPEVQWGFDAGKARGLLGREWVGFGKSVLDSMESFAKFGEA
ncbi:SGNH hydrolase-type esterase domain-containing protein [Cercophora newfieldiana]|uniref:SGNH hydrolase-type esterase domain-containing protein n=1 Tax=Cercophora newfieldiana TaxID=92897 RepID=A0AA40CZL9_9PEZI|nr:SGNH hydrolase-type esterase domain-containing protein [Cercophora newfieldiana]